MYISPKYKYFYKDSSDFVTCGIRSLLRIEAERPSIFVAGAQKSGTTSLYAYLSQHPQFIPAKRKELHFFQRPESRRKGISHYLNLFPRKTRVARRSLLLGRPVFTGEATPYMYNHHVPKLIAAEFPDARLIFLLRCPVARAFSHFQHNVRAGRETRSFSDAIRSEASFIADDLQASLADPWHDDYRNRVFSYVRGGMYCDQLKYWETHFSGGQILLLRHVDLSKSPASTMQRICDFLGFEHHDFHFSKKSNIGGYSESMRPADRDYLSKVYESELDRLWQRYQIDLRPVASQAATSRACDSGTDA